MIHAKRISEINNHSITLVSIDGNTYIMMKPVCSYFGIDSKENFDRLSKDVSFNKSVIEINNPEGAGVLRCIEPARIVAWIMTLKSDIEDVDCKKKEFIEKLEDIFKLEEYKEFCYNTKKRHLLSKYMEKQEIIAEAYEQLANIIDLEIKLIEEFSEMGYVKIKND